MHLINDLDLRVKTGSSYRKSSGRHRFLECSRTFTCLKIVTPMAGLFQEALESTIANSTCS